MRALTARFCPGQSLTDTFTEGPRNIPAVLWDPTPTYDALIDFLEAALEPLEGLRVVRDSYGSVLLSIPARVLMERSKLDPMQVWRDLVQVAVNGSGHRGVLTFDDVIEVEPAQRLELTEATSELRQLAAGQDRR